MPTTLYKVRQNNEKRKMSANVSHSELPSEPIPKLADDVKKDSIFWQEQLFRFMRAHIPKSNKALNLEGVIVADTIVFDSGIPVAWYFTNKDGKLMRKHAKRLTSDVIHKELIKKADAMRVLWQTSRGTVDCVAVYLPNTSVASTAGGSVYGAQGDSTLSKATFLTRKSLLEFLNPTTAAGRRSRDGLLQMYVPTGAMKVSLIRVVWNPQSSLVERRTNVHFATDKKKPRQQRLGTYEDISAPCETKIVKDGPITNYLVKVCRGIATHVSRTQNLTITQMTLYFRQCSVSGGNNIYLLYGAYTTTSNNRQSVRRPAHVEAKLVQATRREAAKKQKQKRLAKQKQEQLRRKNWDLNGVPLAKLAKARQHEDRLAAVVESLANRTHKTKMREMVHCQSCSMSLIEKSKRNFVLFRKYLESEIMALCGSTCILPSASEVLQCLKKLYAKRADNVFERVKHEPLLFLNKLVTVCDGCEERISKVFNLELTRHLDDLVRACRSLPEVIDTVTTVEEDAELLQLTPFQRRRRLLELLDDASEPKPQQEGKKKFNRGLSALKSLDTKEQEELMNKDLSLAKHTQDDFLEKQKRATRRTTLQKELLLVQREINEHVDTKAEMARSPEPSRRATLADKVTLKKSTSTAGKTRPVAPNLLQQQQSQQRKAIRFETWKRKKDEEIRSKLFKDTSSLFYVPASERRTKKRAQTAEEEEFLWWKEVSQMYERKEQLRKENEDAAKKEEGAKQGMRQPLAGSKRRARLAKRNDSSSNLERHLQTGFLDKNSPSERIVDEKNVMLPEEQVRRASVHRENTRAQLPVPENGGRRRTSSAGSDSRSRRTSSVSSRGSRNSVSRGSLIDAYGNRISEKDREKVMQDAIMDTLFAQRRPSARPSLSALDSPTAPTALQKSLVGRKGSKHLGDLPL